MSLMKGFRDYVATLGVVGWIRISIFIILIVALAVQCSKNRRYKKILRESGNVTVAPKTPITLEAEELNREVNEKGQEVVTFEQAKPIIEFIEIAVEDKTRIDSVIRLANVEKNKVAAVTAINGTLLKENTDLKRYVQDVESGGKDTVFKYTDPWFSAEGFRKNDTVFTLRNITANMSVNKIDHTKKKYWLFGENQNLSTVYYDSPYARVDGMKTLTIRQPEPKFKLNVNFGGKYLHTPKQVLIGPSVRLGIGRVGVNGGYYINPGGSIGNTVWYGADYSIY